MNAGFSFQQQAATRCVEGDAMLDLQVAQAREYVGQLLLPLPNHLQGVEILQQTVTRQSSRIITSGGGKLPASISLCSFCLC